MDRKRKLRERKLREQEQKADDILKAARKVFLKKGFFKTTMDEIAYEVALSKPTIYKFFPTKESLYFSLVIPILQKWLDDLGEIHVQLQLNMYNSGETFLREMMSVFFKYYRDNPDLFRIGQLFQQSGKLFSLDSKTDSTIREMSRAVISEMRSLYESAAKQGLVLDIDCYTFAEVLMGSIFGITQLHDARKGERKSVHQLEAVVDAAVKLFARSVVLK